MGSSVVMVIGMWGAGRGWMRGRSQVRLAELLAGLLALVELGGERLGGPPAEGLLDEPAGLAALAAGEAPGLDRRLALRADGDLDGLHERTSDWIVSLIEPSARGCSTTEWPRLRASIRGLLDGVGLEEAVEVLLRAPGAAVVVVADSSPVWTSQTTG